MTAGSQLGDLATVMRARRIDPDAIGTGHACDPR
jgi:hypothetical protein